MNLRRSIFALIRSARQPDWTEEHAVPWSKLTYDTNLGGYRTDITEQQLRGAPAFSRDRSYDWSDRDRERELHDYYGASYYW
jgi:hypothetical protein